jgi:hypothetical protein
MVIILDTNQLVSNRSLDTPAMNLLQAVAKATGHQLAVPGLVVDEFVARYEHSVKDAVDTAERALRAVRDLVPGAKVQVPPLPAPSAAAMDSGQRLREIFQILPVPVGVASTALRREVVRQLPASTNWERPGFGARDAAIWLTALQAGAGGEHVFFVSRDKAAFGDGRLHTILEEEAAAAGTSLTYCTGIDELLEILAVKRELADDDDAGIAAASIVRAAVVNELSRPEVLFEILDRIPALPRIGGTSSGDISLELNRASKSRAYFVNGRLWASGRMHWRVKKTFTRRDPSSRLIDEWVTRFQVSTALLVELDENKTVVDAQVISHGPIEVHDLYPDRTTYAPNPPWA